MRQVLKSGLSFDPESQKTGPIRTCAGCSAKRPKTALTRMVLDREGRVVWDMCQTLSGRGAYVCPSGRCLAAALKRGRLNRSFRRVVSTELLEASSAPWEDDYYDFESQRSGLPVDGATSPGPNSEDG